MDIDKLNMAIMNIPCVLPDGANNHTVQFAYKLGHRDARYAAVEILLEHFKNGAEPSVAAGGERIKEALQEGERRGRAVIDNHLQMMETNRHYRERVFNAIVERDAKEGLHRFIRAARASPAVSQKAAPVASALPEKLPDEALRYVMGCTGQNNPDGARRVKSIYHFIREAITSPVPAEPCDYFMPAGRLCPKCGNIHGSTTDTQQAVSQMDGAAVELCQRCADFGECNPLGARGCEATTASASRHADWCIGGEKGPCNCRTQAPSREPHPITDTELRDPEYMRGYVEGCTDTLAEVLAENKRLRAALAQQGASHAANAGDDAKRIDFLYRIAMVEPFIAPIATKEEWLSSIDRGIASSAAQEAK